MPVLHAGAIERAYNLPPSHGRVRTCKTTGYPTVQLLDIKAISNVPVGTSVRYRLVISDGQHFMQAMLATQHNMMVEQRTIAKFSAVRLHEFTSQVVMNRRIVIILNLDPIASGLEMIGRPAPL